MNFIEKWIRRIVREEIQKSKPSKEDLLKALQDGLSEGLKLAPREDA